MRSRIPSDVRFQVGALLLVSAAAIWLWPASGVLGLKEWLDGLAPDGRAAFVSPDRLRDLARLEAAILPCLLLGWFLMRRTRVATPGDAAAAARRIPWVEAALAVTVVLMGLARLESDPPRTKDTKFYLSESLDAAALGGPAGLVRGCFTGEYRHDNRHPFYPGVLSAIAEPSGRFTDRARLFSLLGALLAFVLFLRLCRRAGGPDAGAVGGALLATNETFLTHSVSVACETWWMAFAVLWFDHLTRPDDGHPIRHAAVAGAAAAMAWLTKGTGTLLLGAGALHVLVLGSGRSRRAVRLGAYLLVFAVVGLPLLWRNARVFGHPLWNINSSKVMWLDRWADFHDADAMNRAGPVAYLRTHSAGDIGKRLAVGSAKQGFFLLGTLAPFKEHAGLGLAVLGLIVLGLRPGFDPSRRRLLVLLFALYFAGFAWYSRVVADGRFLAALVPLLHVPAAHLRARSPRRAPSWNLTLTAAAVAVLLAVLAVRGGALDYRPDTFEPSPDAPAVHRFLRERVGGNEYADYYLGPSERIRFDWDRRIRGRRHLLPVHPSELRRDPDAPPGPRFAVVEIDAPVAPDVLDIWLARDAGGGWRPEPPAGWALVEQIPTEAPRIFLFAREAAAGGR